MPPKKKGGKAKKEAAPVLTGPEAELEAERQLLIAEAKALKRRKEMEEVEYNEYQQEKVGSGIHAPSRVFFNENRCEHWILPLRLVHGVWFCRKNPMTLPCC